MDVRVQQFVLVFSGVWLISSAIWFGMDKGDELYTLLTWRSSTLDSVMVFITSLSEEWVYIALGVIMLFKNIRHTIIIGLAGITSLVVTSPLKELFEMPRPRVWLSVRHQLEPFEGIDGNYIHDGFNSFPSGHTLSAFVLATVCSYLYPKGRWVWLILAMAVGFSRMYLVQHFFEDVLFGSILGVIFALVMLKLVENKWNGLNRSIL